MSTNSSVLLGMCPIRITNTALDRGWHDVIADAVDAWETAFETGDPFWISAVLNRIRRVAEASGGMIEVETSCC